MATMPSTTVLGEAAMVAFGQRLGRACRQQAAAVIFLQGDLGMGKTTLCRGILQAYGHRGVVKSPTYTLVEPYEFSHGPAYHFDLYRLGDPQELEYMGIRDYFSENSLCLVEWAEKAGMFLPAADLVVRIEPLPVLATISRETSIVAGRSLTLAAQTATGEAISRAAINTLPVDG